MRSLYVAVLMGTFIAGTFSLQAFATGNVLVPSTNSGNSPDTNLGLVPENPTPPSSPTSNTSPPVSLPNMQNLSDTAPGQSTSLPYTPVHPTPGPTPTLPTPGTETQIVKIPVPLTPSIPDVNLPNSVSIDMDGTWSSLALTKINDQLGIPSNKVPSTCQMAAKGMIITDKGGVPFDGGISPHVIGKYDGRMNELMVVSSVYCNTLFPLPSHKGIVLQAEDKYFLPLTSGSCSMPGFASAPSKILVVNHNDGTLTCQYH